MFHDIAQPTGKVGRRRAYVLPVSIVVHVLGLAALLAAQAVAPDVLPTPSEVLAITFGDIQLPPEPVVVTDYAKAGDDRGRGPTVATTAPVTAPEGIPPLTAGPCSQVDDLCSRPVTSSEGLPGSDIGKVLGDGVLPSPPPPPPKPAPRSDEAPRRIGGEIRPPSKTKDVQPEYPPLALTARAQGVVIVETIIDVNGKVVDAKILRSVPLLDDAALAAVRQWEFTPTLLNGVPIPIVMTVTVRFTLQ